MNIIKLTLPLIGFLIGSDATSMWKILGGNIVLSESDYPFVVSIQTIFKSNPVGNYRVIFNETCGGAIITPHWIVTAAHCAYKTNARISQIAVTNVKGETTLSDEAILHPQYNRESFKNDIALIKLRSESTFDSNPIKLSLEEPRENDYCLTLGWGSTSNYPREKSFYLRSLNMKMIPLDECNKRHEFILNRNQKLDRNQICFLSESGSTCVGDSGGPLICDGALVGVLSFGTVTCGLGLPDIYTNLIAYKLWIDGTIENF